MKKFWNLMVVALVMLGAAACTETDENVDQQAAGLSFYAEIVNDDTRAYIDDSDGDKTWETIWEVGDELLVEANGKFYTFVYDGEKFTCEEDGVTSLVGQTVTVSCDCKYRDSKAGKNGWGINGTQVENFADGATVKLEANTSFFRYTYNGDSDITFKVVVTGESVENKPLVFQDGDLNFSEEVTISGVKGENFVAFWTQHLGAIEATLSYSIDGVKCKETTLQLAPGKIYNLGTLTDPAPAYDLSAYSVVGTHNDWTAGGTPMCIVGDYCVAFGVEFAGTENKFKVLGNDMWLGVDNYALGTWMTVSTGAGDIYVTAGTYDIYYSESENKVCVVATGAEVPAMPVFSVGVVGFGDNWDTDVDMTLEGDYYTLKSVAIAATDTFKIRISDSWDENYGIASSEEVETIAINANAMYTLVQNGKNMQVEAGTYDLYFNYSTKEFYVLTEGTTPADLEIPQYKIYVYQYNNTWSPLCLYTWDSSDVKHTGDWPGSATEVTETINGYEYMVWTMPRVATSKQLNLILNDNGAGSQTADFALGTLDKDYYLLLNGTAVSFIEDKENPEPEIPVTGEVSDIGVVGSFQGWNVASPVAMVTTADGWIVASGVELYKSDEFKFVKGNTWDVNYGNMDTVLVAEVDKEYTLSTSNPQNIKASKNGKFDIYFNATTLAFKYECVEEYTDLTVNITIDNKANWSPLYITLMSGDTTVVNGATVTDNKYAISGDYIGESLSYVLSNGSKTSEGNITITKDGATINLEETIIKLKVQLNTTNSQQWWGSTMKIHVWSTGTSFDTSWPGVAMTSEGNYTWSINVPSELVGKTINFLVHNGNGWQSSDSTVTIKAEGNTVTGSSIGIN